MEYSQANNREKLMATSTHGEKKKKGEAGATETQGKLVAVRREPRMQNLLQSISHTQSEARKQRDHPIDVV